jgi:hypothetical protein
MINDSTSKESIMEIRTKEFIPVSPRFIPGREASAGYQYYGLERFKSLALPFVKQLYRTALILTGSPRLAKNLLYDTCLQARHASYRFHNDKDFGTWMFRVLFEKNSSH